jgi:hypothetical protein
MLQFVHLDLDKIFKQLEREKKSEKNKKNEREDGCLRLHWCGGGEGHSAFMVVPPVLYYNGLQRSFDSLHMALICAI